MILTAIKEIRNLHSMNDWMPVIDIIPANIIIAPQVDIFNNLGAAINSLMFKIIWSDMNGSNVEIPEQIVTSGHYDTVQGRNVKRVRVYVKSAVKDFSTPYQIIVTGIKF